MKIKTLEFQDMVSRAIRACSNKDLLAISKLLAIIIKDNELVLQTTDGNTYLYVYKAFDEEVEDFYAVVYADFFAKLIAKMTSTEITINKSDNALIVEGNGKYKVPLVLDEVSGGLVKFPDPIDSFNFTTDGEKINLNTFKDVVFATKSSLAENVDPECYENYYFGDVAIATDTHRICQFDEGLFNGELLLPPELVGLTDVMRGEEMHVTRQNDNVIIFEADDTIIYSHTAEGLDNYNIEGITQLINAEFDSMCKISRPVLLSALDRLALFIEKVDENAIKLTFTDKELVIESMKTNAVEHIEYREMKDAKPFVCEVKIDMLLSQLKTQASDSVTIEYGLDNVIKMIDGSVTQILALIQK